MRIRFICKWASNGIWTSVDGDGNRSSYIVAFDRSTSPKHDGCIWFLYIGPLLLGVGVNVYRKSELAYEESSESDR